MSSRPALPMTLQQLRRYIDRLDRQLLRLLNRRARLVRQIRQLKRRHGLRLVDPAREQAICERLAASSRGPLTAEAVAAIYRVIIRQSRRSAESD